MPLNPKHLNNFGGDVHAVGALDFFVQFCHRSSLPAELPPHIGALTCPLATSSLQDLPPDFSPASIRFEREPLKGHSIVTVKFLLGETEIVWLADGGDPDVWMPMDLWRQVALVPFVLGVEEQGEERNRVFVPAMPADVPRPLERCVGHSDDGGKHERWENMLAFCEAHGAAFPLPKRNEGFVPHLAM